MTRPSSRSGMKTQRYGCKDKPGALVTVSVPLDAECPAQIPVRYPDEDYREYVFWWHDAPADNDPDPRSATHEFVKATSQATYCPQPCGKHYSEPVHHRRGFTCPNGFPCSVCAPTGG